MMKKNLLSDIYDIYEIENNIVNKNSIKCLLKSMVRKNLAYIEGQYYIYDEEMFSFLSATYKKLCQYFDFFYSLKSDLVQMFTFLMESKNNNKEISFNAFFCPGYNDSGGYKDHLGNTTTKKLKILSDITSFLKNEKINHKINLYYCDSFIENCDDKINSNWLKELKVNNDLFIRECQKYFEKSVIHKTSDMEIFKNEESYAGHIDNDIISKVPSKVYRSFYIANEAFYKKLAFTKERIKERNDYLVTMYIMVSNYINNIENGVYLPMENMYDREKIIATNSTCTMYLRQDLVKNYE